MSDTQQLPTWDMTRYFPSFESEEFRKEVREVQALISQLGERVDGLSANEHGSAAEKTAAYLTLAKELAGRGELLSAYTYGHLAVDTRDVGAMKTLSELEIAMVPVQIAETRFAAWIGDQDIDEIIAGSEIAAEHDFLLRRAQFSAQHQMSDAEESLAAEMTLSGGSAWGQLQQQVSSQILVTFEKTPGEEVTLPISDVRNLDTHGDRDVRRRAYEAEVAAWKQWEAPIAAALNGVKGEHSTLSERRHWDSILDQSLHQNHIDREVLDAMMSAATEFFPGLHRYWAAKAKMLGVEKLAWYDVTAPIGTNNRAWSWDEGMTFIKEQFGTFGDRMRDMVQQAVDERWIDAGPREGKVGGAFCMPTSPGRSGVLSNFTPSFAGVSTMAHELGHAYHNVCQQDSSSLWGRATPMTLAETASTFCETILRMAALESGSDDDKLEILEASLVEAGQIIVDISSRFIFEQSVIDRRKQGVISAGEFCELMLAAQKKTYGDAITEDTLHPYMWAVKSHYYSSDFAFYNYPYMFGMLFGMGLYARYQEDPESFRANYDDFLASTGSGDAATLAARFGIDITSKEFWLSSLDVIRKDIDTYVELAASHG